MSAIAKAKLPQVSLQPSAQLFSQLGEMLSQSSKAFSSKNVTTALAETVRRMQSQTSLAELMTLRDIVRELAIQVELVVPVRNALSTVSDELDRARREDAVGKSVLNAAARNGRMTMSTPESILQGNEAMVRAEQNASVTIAASIANNELISSGALQRALGVRRQAISAAVKAKRLFAMVGPSGENYYPAYYADPTLDRRILEQVSKTLASLPASSKHHFFTSKSTNLRESPIDALRKGREAEVLAAAAGFAER